MSDKPDYEAAVGADQAAMDTGIWPDLAGRLNAEEAGPQHILPVRVYYEDTDFSGLVYHASYLRWCERGRTDFVRLLGVEQKALFDGADGQDATFFVVRRMELDYLRPALMDDVLEVVSEVDEIGTASLTISQVIKRGDVALFKAKVLIVLINKEGRPQRMKEGMKRAFGG